MGINESLFLSINNISRLNIYPLNLFNRFIALFAPYILTLELVIVYLVGKRKQALWAFYASILGLFINFTISLFYYHPRPFTVGIGNLLISHTPDSSFPSDHATLAFCIAFGFLHVKEKFLGYIGLFFAILVGFARVFVGIHFPFDILGSFFVGIISIVIINNSSGLLNRLSEYLIKLQVKIFNF